MPENILHCVFTTSNPDLPCFIDPRGNLVRKFSRAEVAEYAAQFAAGLTTAESRKGKRVAIIARTSFFSVVATLGNLLSGHVNVIIPFDVSVEQQSKALADSHAETLIVEDYKTARAILDHVKYMPQLRQIVILNKGEFEKPAEILCLGWDELMDRGETKLSKSAEEFLSDINSEDGAYQFFVPDSEDNNALSPLSLTHQKVQELLEHAKDDYEAQAQPLGNGRDRILSVVPFHRVFSHISGIFLPLALGLPFMAVDKEDAWKSGNLPIKPTLLIAESAFLEKVADDTYSAMQQAGGLSKWMQTKAEQWGKTHYDAEKALQSPALFAAITRNMFKPTLHARLAQQIGGVIQLAITIDQEVAQDGERFYYTADIPVLKNDTSYHKLMNAAADEEKIAA